MNFKVTLWNWNPNCYHVNIKINLKNMYGADCWRKLNLLNNIFLHFYTFIEISQCTNTHVSFMQSVVPVSRSILLEYTRTVGVSISCDSDGVALAGYWRQKFCTVAPLLVGKLLCDWNSLILKNKIPKWPLWAFLWILCSFFHPTAHKVCWGIVFTRGVCMGGREVGKSLSRLYLRNRKV